MATRIGSLVCGLGLVFAQSMGCAMPPSQAPTLPPEPAPTGAQSAASVPTALASPSVSLDTPVPTESGAPWVKHLVSEDTTAGGGDLAASADGGSQLIHVVVSNLEEAWDNGAEDATGYLRSADRGMTWQDEYLIGGIFPRIATDEQHVYVAVAAHDCGAGLGVLHNDDHGREGAWSGPVCLTDSRTLNSSGAPAIAATGGLVYVAAADPDTGEVEVYVSGDHAETWSTVALGGARDGEGSPGGPVEVAADGAGAAVAWSDGRTVVARMSVDSGREWSDATDLSAGSLRAASSRESRFAFSGFGDDGSPWVWTWTNPGGWTKAAETPASTAPSFGAFAGPVALGPGTNLAVVYPACHSVNPVAAGETWWVMSGDDGRTWEPPERIARCTDEGRLLWTGAGDVFALLYLEGYEILARQ